jgi:predicted TIM-barrel fold metal-dependent hydrolase
MLRPVDRIDRREFAKLAMAYVAVSSGLAACSSPSDYTEEDAARLARQKQIEAENAGRGEHGELRFRGYRELAQLPCFELDRNGQLRCTVEGLPRGIDLHAHLGMAFLLAPSIDLQRRTERTRYLLDCDREDPGCALDLDKYINANFTDAMHQEMTTELRNQLLWGSAAASTHTIPNLVAELDAMKFHQAAVLAIAPGFPFGDNVTETWMREIASADATDRLLLFASVHPSDRKWRERLRSFAKRGVHGVKVHPEMQRLFPDDEGAMEIYSECEHLGLPVIFHAGRSGIEPEFMRKYALMRRYERGIAAFPRVQFLLGHAGARDVDDAVELARKYPNVWLEITGQGVSQLQRIMNDTGTDRLLFGSDWPFYPLAATLAKVLLVTETRPTVRAGIVRHNAERMFQAAAMTRRAAS